MSATVKLSEDSCKMCKSIGEKQATPDSFFVKLKDGSFQGIVCVKHLVGLLKETK
jgi:hypothetical protein